MAADPPSTTTTTGFDPSGLFQLKAAEHLEWQPQSQTLQATGNIHLTYKAFTVRANRARLVYKESTNNAPTANQTMEQIVSLNLDGSVVLKNDLYQITSDDLDYRFSDRQIILTGQPVILKNATDVAKIWGTVIVDLDKHRVDGTGPVQLTRQQYDVKGEDITLMFLPWTLETLQDAVLEKATLHQRVNINYPDLHITSDTGLYQQSNQTVTLTPNVVITRQSSVIKTDKATLDLTTRRIQLSSPKQPVTGKIHIPDFEKKKETP